MHSCQGKNMVGPCSCGLFHNQGNSTSCFSMLFSMPDHHHHYKSYEETTNMYSFSSSSSSSSSSSVDCTLSLGTPSTRLSNQEYDHEKQRSRCMSNVRWDMWQSKSSSSTYTPPTQQSHRTNSRSGSNNNGGSSNSSGCNSTNDPLLARRCANCDTTSTPLWRNGPRGPKSLCNACGIRFKKEERRATNGSGSNNGGGSSGVVMEPQQHSYDSWIHQSQKMPCYSQANEYRFIEESSNLDSSADHNNGIPFLSWRLNVTDRPTSLVHDFTR